MARIPGQLEEAQLHNLSTDPANLPDGKIWLNTTVNKIKAYVQTAVRILVTEDQSQTLTNKTIDADANTISNIDNADIKIAAAIDALKIANGSVSNAEFQYLDGVTSAIQAQLDSKAPVIGTPTLAGNNAFTGDNSFSGALQGNVVQDGSTGANATLPAPASLITLSNGALTGIAGFTSVAAARLFIWTNVTGGVVTIKNESGSASAANRILTGSGADITVKNNASIWLYKDTALDRWRIVGGSGGSGGLAAGTDSISNGVSSHNVTFSSTLLTSAYVVSIAITNLTDADPIFINYVVTAKSTTGMTVKFNTPTDSANYKLEYSINAAI